jgi:hypothetical protein
MVPLSQENSWLLYDKVVLIFYYMVDLHYLIIVFGYLFPLSLLLQDYVPEYDEITAKLVWEEVDRLTA